jgi:hypothetical protein
LLVPAITSAAASILIVSTLGGLAARIYESFAKGSGPRVARSIIRVLAVVAVLSTIVLAVKVGVVDSNHSNLLSAQYLNHLLKVGPASRANAYYSGAASSAAAFSSAQATQGLVIVTLGLSAATMLAIFARDPKTPPVEVVVI